MLAVVEAYVGTDQVKLLSKYICALRDALKTSSCTGLGRDFKDAWRKSADDEKFCEAQNYYRDEHNFVPAVCMAQRDGLGTLGQFIYYDAIVMHGSDDEKKPASLEGIREAAIKHAKKLPTNRDEEIAYLRAFLDARADVMRNEPDH